MAERKARTASDTTGRKQAARVPGKNPHTGQPQGELLRHPPGSNGSTHRGPDLKPRHIIRAIHLKTITDVGQLALPPDSENGRRKSGAARRKRAQAPHAFITNAAIANQGIALDAAEGDPVARGQLLRLLHDMHETLQPGATPAAAARHARDAAAGPGRGERWRRPDPAEVQPAQAAAPRT
jgi:hypothetical protein